MPDAKVLKKGKVAASGATATPPTSNPPAPVPVLNKKKNQTPLEGEGAQAAEGEEIVVIRLEAEEGGGEVTG